MMASGKEIPLPLPKPAILQAGVKTPNGQPSADTHKPQLAASSTTRLRRPALCTVALRFMVLIARHCGWCINVRCALEQGPFTQVATVSVPENQFATINVAKMNSPVYKFEVPD